MVQLPLGAPYIPPFTNLPAGYVAASPANNQRLLDAWTGTQTTLYGNTFYLSTQGGSGAWRTTNLSATIDSILATAQSAGLNMVRVTDYFDNSTAAQQWDQPQIWTNIDYLVASAQLRGMYVLMDLSGWQKWMQSQGGTGANDPAVAANWTPLLNAAGAHYSTAKNVCWYSIVGEPTPPADATTTTALVTYYQTLTDTLAAADANHLISAGGFLHMMDHPELSWWQQIWALPHNHICSYKTYSQDDLDLTNFIGRFTATLGKPLCQEEFGAQNQLGDTVWSGITWNNVKMSMADYYRQVYHRGWEAGTSSFVFWNLGYQTGNPTGYDISPVTMPGTWAVVQEAATGNSPIRVSVNGAALDSATFAAAGSIVVNAAVGQRTTADMALVDVNGIQHYEQGEPVTITDDFGARLFAGVITSAKETLSSQMPLLEHDVACADWHYLADKRAFPYSNVNVTLATIVKDMLSQVLAAEGVVAAFGANVMSPNQSLGAEEDLQGFVSLNNSVLSQDPTQICPLAGGLGGSLKVVASGAQTFQTVEVRVPVAVVPGAAGAQITISAYMKCLSGTPTLRFYIQGTSGSLGGANNVTLSTTWTRYTWTATMPNPIVGSTLSLRVDTNTPAQAVTWWMDGLQMELGAAATAWQMGGPATVQTGPTVVEFTSNYATCAAGLDALSQAANFVWQIDANKVLWCGVQGQQLAPWSAGEGDMLRGSAQVEHSNPLYRNRQYILGAMDQTTTQVEARQGDGTTTAFTMSYALAKVPTITVNGAAQTVGIGGVDTGKQWYWNGGSNVVSQDTSGTPLNAVYQTLIATGATSGTFTLSYKGAATANINWNDSAATVQTRLQALTTVGSGNALVTGGPLPGTSLLITFAATLAHDGTQVAIGTNALVGGTPTLATVSPLSVTYVGQYPIVVLSTNDAEITAQLAREANVGTGYVEDATGVAGIKTRAGAYQVAAGYIAKFAQVGRSLTFHTYRGGLAPGQLLGVTLPDYALAGEQMFLQSVSAQHDGLLHFDYSVTAIEGPINASWVQYFGALAAKGPTLVDTINLGTGTTLALLQTFTGTKAPTASFTTLVTACPICNTTLICGAATPIVC